MFSCLIFVLTFYLALHTEIFWHKFWQSTGHFKTWKASNSRLRGAQIEASKAPNSKHERRPTRSTKGAQLEAWEVPNSRHERCPTRGMRGAQLEAPKVPNLRHERCLTRLPCLEVGTLHASSSAPVTPRVGHLSCLELGTFDASSWAPLMLELGTSHASSWVWVGHLSCLESGTFDASSRAPLMPNLKHEGCPTLGMRCPTRSMKGAQLEAWEVPNSRHAKCLTRRIKYV